MTSDEERSIRHQAGVMARSVRSRAAIADRYAARCFDGGMPKQGQSFQDAAELLEQVARKLDRAAG
jgi:hypothetical protein